MELCASYLQKCVGCAYETARQGWQALASAIGWWSVPAGRVEAMGGQLRRLKAGQRHGQHLLIPAEATTPLRALAHDLGVLQATPDDQLRWEPVRPRRKGSGLVCQCPFHNDQRPSMLLDPARRRATCLTCGTRHRLDATRWRVSAPLRPPAATTEPPCVSSTGTTGYRQAPGWVVGVLRGGLQTVLERGAGLLEVLRGAEARARRAAPPVLGSQRAARPPDLLVYLDAVLPTGWTQARGRWVPTGQRPIAEHWIAADIDGIDLPNVLDAADGSELRAAGARIEAWARTVAELSGRVAVTQTSLHGVQVVAELRDPRPPGWRRTAGAELCDRLDAVVLRELEAAGYLGGHPDPTVRIAGRLIRRPGPRLDKRGQPWVSRLRFCSG